MARTDGGKLVLISTKRRAIVALVVAAWFAVSRFCIPKKYQHLGEVHLTSWRALATHWFTASFDLFFIFYFGWLLCWFVRRMEQAERIYFGAFVVGATFALLRVFLPANWGASVGDLSELLDLVMLIAAAFLMRDLILPERSSAETPPL